MRRPGFAGQSVGKGMEMSELRQELHDPVLSVYDVEFPDRKTKRKAMTILKGHQKYPCGAPTMGFLIVDRKEYPACAEMIEVLASTPSDGPAIRACRPAAHRQSGPVAEDDVVELATPGSVEVSNLH